MRLEELLRLIAGVFVLLAVVLGATVHPYWNYFAGFVALNLIQSAFTGWCPMMALLRRLGVQEQCYDNPTHAERFVSQRQGTTRHAR